MKFTELPDVRTTRGAWEKEAAALRDNRYEWAHFDEYDDATSQQRGAFAGHIRGGHLKAFRPAGSFEARTVKGKVFVRYVGDD